VTDFAALPTTFGDDELLAPDSSSSGPEPRELFVRHARKDGRSVAMIRAVDYGDRSVVNAEVFPHDRPDQAPVSPGPYTFPDAREAATFVTAAVEALMVLGCDVHAL
jgi:hypothetical protein